MHNIVFLMISHIFQLIWADWWYWYQYVYTFFVRLTADLQISFVVIIWNYVVMSTFIMMAYQQMELSYAFQNVHFHWAKTFCFALSTLECRVGKIAHRSNIFLTLIYVLHNPSP